MATTRSQDRFMPRVSIIIPCFNAEGFLHAAVYSALAQTYAHCEIVVVDDGSTDGSSRILESFGSKIISVSGPKRGAGVARNIGLRLATGDYVKFLDADDLLSPNTVQAQVEVGERLGDVVVYGPWDWLRMCDGREEVVASEVQIREEEDLLEQWLRGNFCAAHSLLWPRKTLDALRGWDESLVANQDGDLFLRALMQGQRFVYAPGGNVIYRTVIGSGTVSADRKLASFRSRKRVLDQLRDSLNAKNLLGRYAYLLGCNYCYLVRVYAALDVPELDSCFAEGLRLTRGVVPGSWIHKGIVKWIGIRRKERLAKTLAVISRSLSGLRGR